jgi:hypothetical protein
MKTTRTTTTELDVGPEFTFQGRLRALRRPLLLCGNSVAGLANPGNSRPYKRLRRFLGEPR